jgi:hypothetical protein
VRPFAVEVCRNRVDGDGRYWKAWTQQKYAVPTTAGASESVHPSDGSGVGMDESKGSLVEQVTPNGAEAVQRVPAFAAHPEAPTTSLSPLKSASGPVPASPVAG